VGAAQRKKPFFACFEANKKETYTLFCVGLFSLQRFVLRSCLPEIRFAAAAFPDAFLPNDMKLV